MPILIYLSCNFYHQREQYLTRYNLLLNGYRVFHLINSSFSIAPWTITVNRVWYAINKF